MASADFILEAQQLAIDLSELFASGELSDADMDGIMIVMQKAYFKHKEERLKKKSQERPEKGQDTPKTE